MQLSWAYNQTWTGDLFLTKEVLYRLSYVGSERETRLEPATLSLEGWCSTNWATPANCGPGWIWTTVGITPADLQSAAIDRSAISPTDFFNFKRALFVEPAKGLEPPTIWLQIRRSTSWATPAKKVQICKISYHPLITKNASSLTTMREQPRNLYITYLTTKHL